MVKLKQPTKTEFKELLEREIAIWSKKVDESEGVMKEQAIGRKMELVWLLDVFTGSLK